MSWPQEAMEVDWGGAIQVVNKLALGIGDVGKGIKPVAEVDGGLEDVGGVWQRVGEHGPGGEESGLIEGGSEEVEGIVGVDD